VAGRVMADLPGAGIGTAGPFQLGSSKHATRSTRNPAARQPRNCVGWLLLAVGLCLTVSFASQSYARYALVTAPGFLPGGRYASFLFLPYFGAVAIVACFLPLYFPTGRLLSPR
jgi:hypothetical protein